MDRSRVMKVLRNAKKLAKEYRTLTGNPLGITGEVAEYEAARLLHVESHTSTPDGIRRDRAESGETLATANQGPMHFAWMQTAGFNRYSQEMGRSSNGFTGREV
jgi:hypothetical protein